MDQEPLHINDAMPSPLKDAVGETSIFTAVSLWLINVSKPLSNYIIGAWCCTFNVFDSGIFLAVKTSCSHCHGDTA